MSADISAEFSVMISNVNIMRFAENIPLIRLENPSEQAQVLNASFLPVGRCTEEP